MKERRTATIGLICVLLAIGIFFIDLGTPRGIAEATLYSVVVFIALLAQRPLVVILIALLCSALTVAGYFVSEELFSEQTKYIANRAFALLAIWLVAGLGLIVSNYQRKRDRLQRLVDVSESQELAAQNIQRKLLPETNPEIEGFEIAGVCSTVRPTGGDFYDFIRMRDGRLGITVGDVSGHGLAPSLLMALVHAFLRVLASSIDDAGEVLRVTNLLIWDDMEDDMFATVFFGTLEPGTRKFTYASAGQEAYLFHAGGKVTNMHLTGPPIGVEKKQAFSLSEPIQLHEGDLLLITTDGIFDARCTEGDRFGPTRMIQNIQDNLERSAQDIVDTLIARVEEFSQGEPQTDDITMVALKVTAA